MCFALPSFTTQKCVLWSVQTGNKSRRIDSFCDFKSLIWERRLSGINPIGAPFASQAHESRHVAPFCRAQLIHTLADHQTLMSLWRRSGRCRLRSRARAQARAKDRDRAARRGSSRPPLNWREPRWADLGLLSSRLCSKSE